MRLAVHSARFAKQLLRRNIYQRCSSSSSPAILQTRRRCHSGHHGSSGVDRRRQPHQCCCRLIAGALPTLESFVLTPRYRIRALQDSLAPCNTHRPALVSHPGRLASAMQTGVCSGNHQPFSFSLLTCISGILLCWLLSTSVLLRCRIKNMYPPSHTVSTRYRRGACRVLPSTEAVQDPRNLPRSRTDHVGVVEIVVGGFLATVGPHPSIGGGPSSEALLHAYA